MSIQKEAQLFISQNGAAHIWHQWGEITIIGYHRCLTFNSVDRMNDNEICFKIMTTRGQFYKTFYWSNLLPFQVIPSILVIILYYLGNYHGKKLIALARGGKLKYHSDITENFTIRKDRHCSNLPRYFLKHWPLVLVL